jgi:hypothetical protein
MMLILLAIPSRRSCSNTVSGWLSADWGKTAASRDTLHDEQECVNEPLDALR